MFNKKDLKNSIPADNGLTEKQNLDIAKIKKIMQENNFVFTVDHIVGIKAKPNVVDNKTVPQETIKETK